MKALVQSLVLAAFAFLIAATPAFAQSKPELMAEAKRSFAQRDYTTAGIASAQRAADIYAQLATQAPDNKEKAIYLVGQAEALYFVGNASDDNKLKIEKHWAAYELTGAVAETFGVKDVTKVDAAKLKSTLSATELALLGEGLYYRGINLGQWGAANGVVQSLNKWPELRDTMQLIINLGLAPIHDFGANRTLGRGYYKIPALLGGSQKKALEYLNEAFDKTLDPTKMFSVNGYTNIYLAEVLFDNNGEDRAIEMLEAFVKADANTLNPSNLPENLRAQKDANALLADWK